MKPIPKSVRDALNLEGALEAELASDRNLLPPEPWIEQISQTKGAVVSWIEAQLASEYIPAPGVHVYVRKANSGLRPVPILGVCERVVLRALAESATKDISISQRTPEEYRAFADGPIAYEFRELDSWPDPYEVAFGDLVAGASFRVDSYVVESDIASFYDYVDHEVLTQELVLQGGSVEEAKALAEFLGEVQARGFGIPQLFDASDWLSEVYASIVERHVVRAGHRVWRFNDDFRIHAGSYPRALEAVEDLAVGMRQVGVVPNDGKTRIPRLSTYYIERGGDETYLPDPDLALAAAREFLSRMTDGSPARQIAVESISVKHLTRAQLRLTRSAVVAHEKELDANALSYVPLLVTYLPALTPEVCSYLVALGHNGHADEVVSVLEDVVDHASLGSWREAWFAYVIRSLGTAHGTPKLVEWLRGRSVAGRGTLFGAEANLALAAAGVVSIDQLDSLLRSEPEALAPWYLRAIRLLDDHDGGKHHRRVEAIASVSPLYRALLASDSL